MTKAWQDSVIEFWFAELAPADWFRKSDATDELITSRFLDLHTRLSAESWRDVVSGPQDALAAIIVFDQFTRNMFRGTPKSFASDHTALAIARHVVDLGWDQGLSVSERSFLYLPFEHSENRDDQNTCVTLMAALGDESLNRYALAHREVIERFGRFPHRNAILGRASTPEELTYLAQPGSGF